MAAQQTESISWETSLQDVQTRAAREGRAILVDFSAAPE
jgi:hypothetical protein